MLPRKILKLRSSEIAGNMYFASYFCIFESSRRATKLYERGTLPEILKIGGSTCPLCPPIPTSMEVPMHNRMLFFSLRLLTCYPYYSGKAKMSA